MIELALPMVIDRGWRCRQTENYFVDVLDMGYNFRLCLTLRRREETCGRAWCYRRSASVLLRAHTFDPEDPASEPEGWIKQTSTERRPCAALYGSALKLHDAYVASCPDCGDESLN